MGNQNSGRRKIYEEWNKVSAINKLWEKVNRKVMANEELTEFEEKLVSSILPKTIKTETDITTNGQSLVPTKEDKEQAFKAIDEFLRLNHKEP